MLVKDAKAIAREWVLAEGSKTPVFFGAFYHGSTNWLPDEAELPPSSDLDVMVVLNAPEPPDKPGKFDYQGVLLEVSYLSRDLLRSPEQVLSNYHMAGSFHAPGIILDPSEELSRLQATVSREYPMRRWVTKRAEHARNHVLNHLQGLNANAPFHNQVMSWLFGAGVTTHILLVAGLKNPTVRRRYMAVRELLAEYDRLDFYETLLEMLGAARMHRERAEHHLTTLANAFDAAASVLKSPYPFAADITPLARPIAIDGSRELIEQGFHREAVFWMVATYSRCQWVLVQDASAEMQERHSAGYHELLADLGITSFMDLQRRGNEVRESLPRVWEVAEVIMATNPAIVDDAPPVSP
jgi:hypothetical protein